MKKTVSASFLKKTTAFLLALVMSVSLIVSASAAEKDTFEEMTSGIIIGDTYSPGISTQIIAQLVLRAASLPGFAANPHIYYIRNSGLPADRGYFNIWSNTSVTAGGANHILPAVAKATIYENVEWGLIGGSLVPYDEETDDPDQKIANAIGTAITGSALTEIVKTAGAIGPITDEVKAALGSAWLTAWTTAGATVAVTAYTAATETAAGSYTVTVSVNGKTAAVPGVIASSGEKKITLGAQVDTMRSNTTAESVKFAVTSQNVSAGALTVTIKNSAGDDVTTQFTVSGNTLAANGTATITIADKTVALPVGAYTVTASRDETTSGPATLTILSAATFTIAGFAFTDVDISGTVTPDTAPSLKVDGTAFITNSTPFTVGVEHKITFNTTNGKAYTGTYKPTTAASPGATVPQDVKATGYYITNFKFRGGIPIGDIDSAPTNSGIKVVKIGNETVDKTFVPFTVNGTSAFTEFKDGETYELTFSVVNGDFTQNYKATYTGKAAHAAGTNIGALPADGVVVTTVGGAQFSIAGFVFQDADGVGITGVPANITVKEGTGAAAPFSATSKFVNGGEYTVEFTTVVNGVTKKYAGTYTAKTDDKDEISPGVIVKGFAEVPNSVKYTVNQVFPYDGSDDTTQAPANITNVKVGGNAFVPRGVPGATEFITGASNYTITFTENASGLLTERTGSYKANDDDASSGKAMFVPLTATAKPRYTVAAITSPVATAGQTGGFTLKKAAVPTAENFAVGTTFSNIQIGDANGLNRVDFVQSGNPNGKTSTEFVVDTYYTIFFTANEGGLIKEYVSLEPYKAVAGDAGGTVSSVDIVARPVTSAAKITRANLTFSADAGSIIASASMGNIIKVNGTPFVSTSAATDTIKATEFTVGQEYTLTFTVAGYPGPGDVSVFDAKWTPTAAQAGDAALTAVLPATVVSTAGKFNVSSINFSDKDNLPALLTSSPIDFKISGGWYGSATTIKASPGAGEVGANEVIFEDGATYTISFELTTGTINTGNYVATTYKATYTPSGTTAKGNPLTIPAEVDDSVGKKFRVPSIIFKDGLKEDTITSAENINIKSSDDDVLKSSSTGWTGAANAVDANVLFQVGKTYTITLTKETGTTATSVLEEYTTTYTGSADDITAAGTNNKDLTLRALTAGKPKRFRVGAFSFVNNSTAQGAAVLSPAPANATMAALGGTFGSPGYALASRVAVTAGNTGTYFVDGVEYIIFLVDTTNSKLYRAVTVWKADLTTGSNGTVRIVVEDIGTP